MAQARARRRDARVLRLRALTFAWLSLAVIGTFAFPTIASATDTGLVATKTAKTPSGAESEIEPILQPYEPLTGGYTHERNDTGFLDVNLSLKVRLFPLKYLPRYFRPYFAMATRFGFYWGSRPNSPVIGKSYNPALLFRFLPTRRQIRGGDPHTFEQAQYIDLIPYAHQSNGQLSTRARTRTSQSIPGAS